jgi:hypothetical protein
MHLVGYFEGIEQRARAGVALRDSLSCARFLRLGTHRAGARPLLAEQDPRALPLEVHEAVFAWVLRRWPSTA